jgi:RimJ/RimL family protein N-acetyltransferase
MDENDATQAGGDRVWLDATESSTRHFDLQPTLFGHLLSLRPLQPEDFAALYAMASDPLIWEQHPVRDRYQLEVFTPFFHQAVESKGALLVQATDHGQVIGMSRFAGYNAERSEIEIGWTFLGRDYWGGRYNGELKQLMLQHAFHFVQRVVFLVHPQNVRSQKAVEKLGAVRIGSRRDGNGYDSIVYQITAKAYRAAAGPPGEAPHPVAPDRAS